jgi:hypothetical protein
VDVLVVEMNPCARRLTPQVMRDANIYKRQNSRQS